MHRISVYAFMCTLYNLTSHYLGGWRSGPTPAKCNGYHGKLCDKGRGLGGTERPPIS